MERTKRLKVLHEFNGEFAGWKTNSPHLILSDASIVYSKNKFAIEQIRSNLPQTKIVLFNINNDQLDLIQLIIKGVTGFIHKCESEKEIRKAVNLVLTETPYLSVELMNLLFEQISKRFHHAEVSTPMSEIEKTIIKTLCTVQNIEKAETQLNMSSFIFGCYLIQVIEKINCHK